MYVLELVVQDVHQSAGGKLHGTCHTQILRCQERISGNGLDIPFTFLICFWAWILQYLQLFVSALPLHSSLGESFNQPGVGWNDVIRSSTELEIKNVSGTDGVSIDGALQLEVVQDFRGKTWQASTECPSLALCSSLVARTPTGIQAPRESFSCRQLVSLCFSPAAGRANCAAVPGEELAWGQHGGCRIINTVAL